MAVFIFVLCSTLFCLVLMSPALTEITMKRMKTNAKIEKTEGNIKKLREWTDETASKMKTLREWNDETAIRMSKLTERTEETASKMKTLTERTEETASKMKTLTERTEETANKMKTLTARTEETASKMKTLTERTEETASKMRKVEDSMRKATVKWSKGEHRMRRAADKIRNVDENTVIKGYATEDGAGSMKEVETVDVNINKPFGIKQCIRKSCREGRKYVYNAIQLSCKLTSSQAVCAYKVQLVTDQEEHRCPEGFNYFDKSTDSCLLVSNTKRKHFDVSAFCDQLEVTKSVALKDMQTRTRYDTELFWIYHEVTLISPRVHACPKHRFTDCLSYNAKFECKVAVCNLTLPVICRHMWLGLYS